MNTRSFLYILLLCPFSFSVAGLDFADQTSAVQVKNGARMYIDTGGQAIDGTLKHDVGSTIDGTALTLNNGIIVRDNKTATLTGGYDADAGPTITLAGSERLDAGRNFAVAALAVSGTNNVLAGSPVLSSALTLPTNVDLRCDLTAPLNKSITLDGGTVTLDADLICANNVSLGGSGTVVLNGYRYVLGGYYENAIDSTLSFTSAQNLELQGKTPLKGDWTFTGTSVLDGKGSTLDLRHEGSLTIGAGARLILRDIQVKGVDSSNIIFGDASSVLELDGTQLEFAGSITNTSGAVEVTGDCTFVLKSYDWSFTDSASLTIDAATLSLNVLSNSATSNTGTIKASRAVYEDRLKQVTNINANIVDGNLVILNGGVITEIEELAGDGLLTGDGVSGEIVLDKSTLMSPEDVILVSENSTIDGKGARVLFARPGTAQFLVSAGVTLTLKNIELHGLTDSTIKLQEGARLNIDKNVIFSLAGDVTWRAEKMKLVGDNTVFEIRSIGSPRSFTLLSDAIGDGSRPHERSYLTHLDLGTNTLSLNNVVFKGLQHVTFSTGLVNGASQTGALALTGDATVKVEQLSIGHNFVVRGIGNKLQLLSDDIYFNGAIKYDDYTTSALHLEFLLPASFYGTPRVHMQAGALKVASAYGHAYLKSDTHSMQLVNEAVDSTVLGDNGFLAGNKVDIALNPIKQLSARVTLCPGLQLTSSLADGALVLDTDLLDTMRLPLSQKSSTAFEYQQMLRVMTEPDALLTRGVQLPDPVFTTIIHYDSAFALPEIAGNITLREEASGCYTNWRMSTSRAANLSLYDGVQLIQSTAATTIKDGDILNVIGGTAQQPNTLQITNDLTIEGNVLLDDDAVLLIRCVPDGTPPAISFTSTSSLSLGARSIIMITGQGTVTLPDQFILDLGASNSTLIIGDGMQLTLSDGQAVTIKGTGTVQFEHGGQMIIEKGSSVTCGTAYIDDISLRVKTGASIRVGDAFSVDSTAASYLSMTLTAGEVDCSQGGSLVIAERGVCEWNALKGVGTPGNIRRLDFGGGGLLYIASGGAMNIGDNLPNLDGLTLALHGGQVSGSGMVGVAGESFSGKIQNNVASVANLSAASLVRTMVQTSTVLLFATQFIDADGSTKVRTKNGAIISLLKNEIITGETSTGVIQGYHSLKGRHFTYDADGVRS